MGIDFIQDRDCRVKRELGLEALVGLQKSQTHAALLLKQFEDRGEDPAGASIRRVVLYPSGPVEEEVGLEELLKAGATLAPYAPLCEGCTANFREEPFGCCGYLNYPVSAAEEQWLMERLPARLDSNAGTYLRSVLREAGVDGSVVARMRNSLFFERKEALVRTWDIAGEAVEVSSDQILQFLFYAGAITPMHGVFLCLFLGFIPHDIGDRTMREVLRNPARLQDHLVLDQAALALLEKTQLGAFLLGMMSAVINGENLLLDA